MRKGVPDLAPVVDSHTDGSPREFRRKEKYISLSRDTIERPIDCLAVDIESSSNFHVGILSARNTQARRPVSTMNKHLAEKAPPFASSVLDVRQSSLLHLLYSQEMSHRKNLKLMKALSIKWVL